MFIWSDDVCLCTQAPAWYCSHRGVQTACYIVSPTMKGCTSYLHTWDTLSGRKTGCGYSKRSNQCGAGAWNQALIQHHLSYQSVRNTYQIQDSPATYIEQTVSCGILMHRLHALEQGFLNLSELFDSVIQSWRLLMLKFEIIEFSSS